MAKFKPANPATPRIRSKPAPVQRAAQPAAEPQATDEAQADAGLARQQNSQQQARMMQRMQRAVGNAQVQRMLHNSAAQPQIQRAPAAPKTAPQQDPRFQSISTKARQVASKEKQHAPARSKAAEAQAAALPPANDVSSQAAAAQVGKMNAQKPGTFNKQQFIAALNAAIAKITPKNQEEADQFKQSGKAGELKGQVTGLVKSNKESAEQAIETTTKEAPSPGNARPKAVTPMKPEEAGAAPGSIGAGNAMPANKTAQETSLAEGKQSLDQRMAAADVTEDQLKKSNEPSFTGALSAKKQVETHATSAPQQFRTQEQAILGQARNEAGAMANQALGGMHTGRIGALGKVLGNKTTAKGQDERKRAEVATKIEGLYSKTKTEVTGILDALDGKVNGAFERGEGAARAAFEQYVDTRMKVYKAKRYGDALGVFKWAKDKLMGMPSEVNAFFQEGHQLYLSRMQSVISSVADVVGGELTRAKARIAQGRQEIQTYVSGLPNELRQVGQQAADNIQSRFDQLEQDVDAKQELLVQSLAQKYVAARDAVDSRISEMQKANQGLVAKAKDALVGVIQTIVELKNMLMGVLGRAAGVIGSIIKDPVRFLGNLLGAVKQGLNQFAGNIGKHLQQGLMGWLFGALSGAGIRMPESLDLKGILTLVMQVMGLTYANIRARAVKLVGEPTVKLMEGTVKVFQVLASEGPAGLWHLIQDKVGDLKEQVIGQIKEFVITKIITAGITWLISLFNPAAAFIKACKMIYDVIMFFIERGSQIMELVGAILDSIGAIASGSIGAAANRVEQTLGKALPVAISFLASLLGLGGISQRVKKIIGSVQKPVFSAIDSVVTAAAKGVKKLTGKGKGKQEKQPGDKDQDSAVKKPINLKRPLSMNGASHTLYIQQKNGRLVVEMASRRDQLKLIVQRAIREEEQGAKRSEVLATLNKVLIKLNELLEFERAGAYSAMPEESITTWTEAVANLLQGLGAEFHIKDLEHLGHPSIYVEGDELKEEYRGGNIRDRFYPSTYRPNTLKWKVQRLQQLTHPSDPSLYKDEMTGKWEPKKLPNGDTNATIDHTYKVADHWNNAGHNMTQEERADFYNDTSKLRLTAARNNSSDGAQAKKEGLQCKPKVGPQFRGPNDTKD